MTIPLPSWMRRLPRGTVRILIEQMVSPPADATERRGGRRTRVDLLVPGEVVHRFLVLPPGRYRISCRDAACRMLRNGACVVEHPGPGSVPDLVPARTPRDYARARTRSVDPALQRRLEAAKRQCTKLAQEVVCAAFVATDFIFTYALVNALRARGVRCFAATSERVVTSKTDANGAAVKEVTFRFVRWREYGGG